MMTALAKYRYTEQLAQVNGIRRVMNVVRFPNSEEQYNVAYGPPGNRNCAVISFGQPTAIKNTNGAYQYEYEVSGMFVMSFVDSERYNGSTSNKFDEVVDALLEKFESPVVLDVDGGHKVRIETLESVEPETKSGVIGVSELNDELCHIIQWQHKIITYQ